MSDDLVEFRMDEQSDSCVEAIKDFVLSMVKEDDVKTWLGSFLCTSENIHKMTGKHGGEFMEFHTSLFITVLINASDCKEKTRAIHRAIELIKTNLPTDSVN